MGGADLRRWAQNPPRHCRVCLRLSALKAAPLKRRQTGVAARTAFGSAERDQSFSRVWVSPGGPASSHECQRATWLRRAPQGGTLSPEKLLVRRRPPRPKRAAGPPRSGRGSRGDGSSEFFMETGLRLTPHCVAHP